MKEKEQPIPWELKDPKPPVIQSGHMENRIRFQRVKEPGNCQNAIN